MAPPVEERQGDSIRAAETALYADLIGEVRPFADARRLMTTLRERGHRLVLASSAKRGAVEVFESLGELCEHLDDTPSAASLGG